ncbi:MAG: hypothetical protein ABSG13_08955 [Bryobacteraceae bacterium]|jgi:hypothetical protein
MAKKTPAKKKAAKRAASAKTTGADKNLAALTKAGVIPADYQLFTPAEKKAIESLSASEVAAIISTKTKMGPEFFSRHATHGMYY